MSRFLQLAGLCKVSGSPLATPMARVFGRSYATAARIPSYVLNTPNTRITTLDNGLKVATEEIPSESVSLGVYINAGSAYETPANNGVAHFLEHMAFKGTKTRTQQGLELEVENIGASLNAYTSREQTVYIAKTFKNDVARGLDILSDILQNSTLEPSKIERERHTILREKEEVQMRKNESIFDYLHASAFQTSPLGRTILGTPENIRNISRQDLQQYISTHYTANRMVVAAAGAVNHDEFVKSVSNSFSSLPTTSSPAYVNREKDIFTGSAVTVMDDTSDEIHVAVAFEGASWESPDYLTLLLIQTIVGNFDRAMGGGKNVSSRLGELVATEGLAHNLTGFNTCYNTTGLFGAYFLTEAAHVEDMLCELLSEYVRLGHGALDSEVERGKKRLKASILNHLEGSTPVCEDLGRQVLTIGRKISPAELFLRIDAIDTKTVKAVARKYLTDTDPAIAAIGNCHTFPDYNQIRGWTVWHRL